MSNTCPIDPTNAINKLKMENESVNALIADIKGSGLLETCPLVPDMTGGKRRRKSKSRSRSRSSSKKIRNI